MKKIFTKILFVIGLLIFLFPFVMRAIAYFNQTTAIYNYKSEVSKTTQEELEKKQQASSEYNNKIADERPIVSMGEEIEETQESQSVFDFLKTGEVIGTLMIPKINVEIPIYDGIDGYNLEKGVAHLNDTSYPTGEPSTHSVLAGHSGLTRAKILDDLDKVVIGDNFQIEYLDTLTNYEVIDIRVVLPYETESLQIQNDETLVTLVTCTPKSINTHRLLVTGKRVEFPVEKTLTWKEEILVFIVQYRIQLIIALVIITFFSILLVVKPKKDKKVKKGRKNKKEENIEQKQEEIVSGQQEKNEINS